MSVLVISILDEVSITNKQSSHARDKVKYQQFKHSRASNSNAKCEIQSKLCPPRVYAYSGIRQV